MRARGREAPTSAATARPPPVFTESSPKRRSRDASCGFFPACLNEAAHVMIRRLGGSADLEHVPISLSLPARRTLRTALGPLLLARRDVRQHLAESFVLDNRRLIDLLQLVESPVGQVAALVA